MKEVNFIPNIMGYLRGIQPVQLESGLYSANATLRNVSRMVIPDARTKQSPISKKEFKEMLMKLHDTPRSQFIRTSITKEPYFGSMTPIPLLAFKEEFGIEYNEWDRTDPLINLFLGKFLQPIVTREHPSESTLSTWTREKMLTDNKGVMQKPTAWKCNIGYKPFNIMHLQTWICNAEIRVPEVMILDWNNWSNTPEAMDIVVPEGDKHILIENAERKQTNDDWDW